MAVTTTPTTTTTTTTTTTAVSAVSLAQVTDAVIELGALALAFGRIDRTAVYHPDRTTPESDTDHTVMLGWIACALAAHWFPHLDVGLVAQYALVHDAPEVYAGDTPTLRITPTERARKAEREHAATQQLTNQFGARLPWFPATVTAYERQDTPEARFVRGVDKILPKIVHLLDGCVGLTDRRIGATEMTRICTTQRRDMAGYLADLPEVLQLHAVLAEQVTARPELARTNDSDPDPDPDSDGRQVADPGAVGHTVPCIWGCGHLAGSETELDEHEQSCEHQTDTDADTGVPTGDLIVVDPVSRSVRSLRRRRRGGPPGPAPATTGGVP